MGMEHALQAFAHGVGSCKVNKIRMGDKNRGYSNFIGPDQ
jgi:hypothetical protein